MAYSWVVDIVRGLRVLGGEGRLPDLYHWVKRNRGQLPLNWEPAIRAALQAHCAKSKQYRPGNPDIFRNTGWGWWAIREITEPNTIKLSPLDLNTLAFLRLVEANGPELAELQAMLASSADPSAAMAAILNRKAEQLKREWLVGSAEA